MTDWCSNYIWVEFRSDELADAFLARIVNEKSEIDFGTLIPMPPILDIVSAGSREIDGILVSNWIEGAGSARVLTALEAEQLSETGFENWRDWSIANWGTKWNAQDTLIDRFGRGMEMKFETAWRPPYPFYMKMLEVFPQISFEIRYRLPDDHEYPHEVFPSDLNE